MPSTPVLRQCVSPTVLQQRTALASEFAQAQPFRHVVIDGFLEPSFCADIVDQFPDFDVKSAINENGQVGGKSTREKVRSLGPAYCCLDDLVQNPEFLGLIEGITGIKDLRYDPYYFGGGTHENRQGQDLDPHVDFNYHPLSRQHRRLNLIIYLNDDWRDEWGGSLQLHRDPYMPPDQDDILTIAPLRNRCVIFETNEYSWHGFERITLPPERQHLSRKSFALYYYTDTRPAGETVEEHSTVYVERHLPGRFREGHTLDSIDVQEIRLMFARRDQHLKRLYRNIHRLYGEVNRQKSLNSAPHGPESSREAQVAENSTADRLIAILRARIRELETSTSWRITAPLRAVKRWLAGPP